MLEQLMAAVADPGRLPEADEFAPSEAVIGCFGSLKRAFALVRRITGEEEWDLVRRRRTEDLLVYLAPGLSALLAVQGDFEEGGHGCPLC